MSVAADLPWPRLPSMLLGAGMAGRPSYAKTPAGRVRGFDGADLNPPGHLD